MPVELAPYPVTVEHAFDVTPLPLPDLFSRRYAAIPPIRGVRDQQGAWGTVGQTRTIRLADGGSIRETLLSVDRPRVHLPAHRHQRADEAAGDRGRGSLALRAGRRQGPGALGWTLRPRGPLGRAAMPSSPGCGAATPPGARGLERILVPDRPFRSRVVCLTTRHGAFSGTTPMSAGRFGSRPSRVLTFPTAPAARATFETVPGAVAQLVARLVRNEGQGFRSLSAPPRSRARRRCAGLVSQGERAVVVRQRAPW